MLACCQRTSNSADSVDEFTGSVCSQDLPVKSMLAPSHGWQRDGSAALTSRRVLGQSV
jgi:hypothetical protein